MMTHIDQNEIAIFRSGAGQSGAMRNSMKTEDIAASGGGKGPEKRGDPLGTNSEIGRKLKQYYADLISNDVPDRFADLLKQLEEREKPDRADGSK
jgi:hypothetical protein